MITIETVEGLTDGRWLYYPWSVEEWETRRQKQTFGPRRQSPCVRHLQCALEQRSQEERERERYKLFESRVEAEGPREGSTRAAAVADEQDILSSKREKDLGGCERASERGGDGGRARRATSEYKRVEPAPGVSSGGEGGHRTFPPMHHRATPYKSGYRHFIPKTKKKRRKERTGRGVTAEYIGTGSGSETACLLSAPPLTAATAFLLLSLHSSSALHSLPPAALVSPGNRPFQMMRYLWGNHFLVVTPFISASLPLSSPAAALRPSPVLRDSR